MAPVLQWVMTMVPLAKALLVPILLLPGGFVLAGALWLLQRHRARMQPTTALAGPGIGAENLDAPG